MLNFTFFYFLKITLLQSHKIWRTRDWYPGNVLFFCIIIFIIHVTESTSSYYERISCRPRIFTIFRWSVNYNSFRMMCRVSAQFFSKWFLKAGLEILHANSKTEYQNTFKCSFVTMRGIIGHNWISFDVFFRKEKTVEGCFG